MMKSTKNTKQVPTVFKNNDLTHFKFFYLLHRTHNFQNFFLFKILKYFASLLHAWLEYLTIEYFNFPKPVRSAYDPGDGGGISSDDDGGGIKDDDDF